jgi:iron complex outermembrane recepter protein
MFRRTTTTLACTFALALPALARAAAPEFSVTLDDGPLSTSLKNLERQTGVELLYDGDVIRNIRSPAINGKLPIEGTLKQMLDGSALKARRASSGAWIIERQTTAPLEQQDAPVAEILVIGTRTQNADIRRTEDDIQPYVVTTKQEIRRAHRDNLDQFFANRITSNTQAPSSNFLLAPDTFSRIDLRGLGPNDTLVLVDGRRMPSLLRTEAGLEQADLNGIPRHAIERVEVLTGAAGGIHGFGALGGVINVVLDRDADGLEIFATGGISSRGDAGHRSYDASYGFNSSDERTRVTAFASYSEVDPLLVGQRGFAARDRRVTAELAPDLYASYDIVGNSVFVTSFGDNLQFKPEFGGAMLDSSFTMMPTGFSGNSAALATALAGHAGEVDTSLSDGDLNRDIGMNPRNESLLFNARHRFIQGAEIYIDALVSSRRGRMSHPSSSGYALMFPESPANPFVNAVEVTFPISLMEYRNKTDIESTRYTAGLMTDLPADWRGTIEASYGGYRYALSTVNLIAPNSLLLLLGDPSDLDTNPFDDWDSFQDAMTSNPGRASVDYHQDNDFRNFSFRLAGPVFRESPRPTTLTLLAEYRKEQVRDTEIVGVAELGDVRTTFTELQPGRSIATTSFQAELRSRVLRGLDLQLAVRRDDQRVEMAEDPVDDVDGYVPLHPRFTSTAFTTGVRVTPSRWLMLRASYATGEQPPQTEDLRMVWNAPFPSAFSSDPKRGNQPLGVNGTYMAKFGGNGDLDASRASTLFLGAVLTPLGESGPSLAIDYSRIRKDRAAMGLSSDELLAHEERFPGRVVRGPLTDADRALGYTGGPVTLLDTRHVNGAGVEVDAFDGRAEWPLTLRDGQVRLYADATYQKSNRQTELFRDNVQYAGFRDGPLKWRANGGFDWTRGRLTAGMNLQYYSGYRVYYDITSDPTTDMLVLAQGSPRIPSQKYLDAHASWRVPLSGSIVVDEMNVDFGIVNLLDATPPRETSISFTDQGYSRYADPRLRRFELVVSCQF